MSAYAHQMERQFSGLSSGENSELGSRFEIESGFYMTSFASTIFLASLLTVGILMTSLLIALSVMLQTCENRNVEALKLPDSFSYCNVLALHAQLNSLEAVEFPLFCREVAVHQIKEGEYLRELNFTIQMAWTYFGSITPSDDKRDAVLIDIDEILASSPQDNSRLMLQHEQDGYREYMEEAKQQKHKLTLELYSKLRSQGYSLVLLSRKSEGQRNASTEQLASAGYRGWSHLIMGPEADTKEDMYKYFARQRADMREEGYRIRGVIGNHLDVLMGPWLGMRVFKLPTSVYYHIVDYSGRQRL